jgi:hypothetical protein
MERGLASLFVELELLLLLLPVGRILRAKNSSGHNDFGQILYDDLLLKCLVWQEAIDKLAYSSLVGMYVIQIEVILVGPVLCFDCQ